MSEEHWKETNETYFCGLMETFILIRRIFLFYNDRTMWLVFVFIVSNKYLRQMFNTQKDESG